LSVSAPALAESSVEVSQAAPAEAPHHISLLLGGTHVDEVDETAPTTGIDYEYRVNSLMGLGFIAERAFGKINATTVLAVADIHIKDGLVLQVGPGIEFIHGSQYAVARLGALYEFEIGHHYTLSPQIHYDATEHDDSIIFGVGIGRHF